MVSLMGDKVVKYGWKVSLIMLWILLLVDLFYRVLFFPAEFVAMHDYFFIVAFSTVYYFSRKQKDKLVMKGSMLGLIVSMISKFGFMAGSMMIWR
jgi:hypothetical protein